MMNLNLRGVLQAKGIENPAAWLKKRKVTDKVADNLVKGQKKQVPLAVLEMLCYELNALPNDFFIWKDDSTHPRIKDHPLEEIHSENVMPNLDYYALKLELKDLRKVEDYMKQLCNESAAERKKRIEERKVQNGKGK